MFSGVIVVLHIGDEEHRQEQTVQSCRRTSYAQPDNFTPCLSCLHHCDNTKKKKSTTDFQILFPQEASAY